MYYCIPDDLILGLRQSVAEALLCIPKSVLKRWVLHLTQDMTGCTLRVAESLPSSATQLQQSTSSPQWTSWFDIKGHPTLSSQWCMVYIHWSLPLLPLVLLIT